MLQVLITAYNCPVFLQRCLRMLRAQRMQTWRAWVTDDVSTDATGQWADLCARSDSRITVLHNSRKYWQVGNYDQVIQRTELHPEDVCVLLDGDDWFPDNDVLGRVLLAYRDPAVWITWGNYRKHNGRPGCSAPVADVTQLRQANWHTSHLRTFKAFLWRAIRREDLLDAAGEWYLTAAGDMAFMFPMLEMATNAHARFLPEINYVYNGSNPQNDDKVHRQEQLDGDRLVRGRPAYSPLVRG